MQNISSLTIIVYKQLIQELVLQVFHGNSGRNDIVKHNLKEIARARFIRFQPTTYSTRKALRVEVFGIIKPAGRCVLLPIIVTSPRSAIMVNLFFITLNKLNLDHLF